MAWTTRPTLRGTFGMASTTHWLATATAVRLLEAGGTAVDAACAAAFALHVVEPHLNGPGGDASILVSVRGGTPRVLCGQGPAPAGATIAHYRDELGLDLVPGTGPLAAAVPGAVDAWLVLLRDEGTMTLRDVLTPAIELAAGGHPLLPQVAGTIAHVADHLREHWPTSAAQWLPGDRPPVAGELFRNPALAATWERLLAEAEAAGGDREAQLEAARRAWREGFVAEALARASAVETMDSSGAPHAGTLTADDPGRWEPTWEDAVTARWGDWEVAKCGSWSQGPVFATQLLMLADTRPGELFADGLTAEAVHRLVENATLAFADRDAHLGDAAAARPLGELLSPAYQAERARLVGPRASDGLRAGSPDGRTPRWPAHVRRLLADAGAPLPSATGVGEPTVRRDGLTRGDTCHLDVVDRWGTMVAATPSGGWLQSNPTVPELGFCLGTRLQMCWLDEGLPASLEPGRRPRTTLSPTIASLDGVPTVAFGTPGGDQQDMWTYHFFLALADAHARTGDLDLQAALDAPNWHTDAVVSSFWPRGYQPRSITLEEGPAAGLADALRGMGHEVTVGPAWSEGRVCAVARDVRRGTLLAGSSPRGSQGYAGGR